MYDWDVRDMLGDFVGAFIIGTILCMLFPFVPAITTLSFWRYDLAISFCFGLIGRRIQYHGYRNF